MVARPVVRKHACHRLRWFEPTTPLWLDEIRGDDLSEPLESWLQQQQPDALVTPYPNICHALSTKTSWKIPQNLGCVATGTAAECPDVSGPETNGASLGREAVYALLNRLHSPSPLEIPDTRLLMKPTWHEGLFLDWTDLQKDGQPALLSLWLLYTLQQLTKLLRPSALPADFEEITKWAQTLETAIGQHLLDKDGLVRDGLTTGGKSSARKSLQAQTLAWMCQLPGFDKEKALAEIFLPWVREDRVTHALPSSYWCAYPLDLLASQGYGKDVVAFIKRHWKAMAAFGSCFENFDPQPEGADMLSHSHAWSAHPLYLLMRTLGGVRQTAPGWQTASVDPVFVGNEAEAVLPTPHGPIRVHWKRATLDAKPKIEMAAPKNVRLASSFLRSEK